MTERSHVVPTPMMLVIMDGWGWREESAYNAVRLARTPFFDHLWQTYTHSFLRASGVDVGLPDGQMGNSEVGHLNIGAGRVVMQELPRINQAIKDGSVANAPALTGLIAALKASRGTCHLLGLVSSGGVHAHQNHAAAIANLLAEAGVGVAVHVLTDGRDTAPSSALDYVAAFEKSLPAQARIATISGRYYAMDRDRRWERTEKAYLAMTVASGPRFPDAIPAIEASYSENVTDEFILPACIGDYGGMQDGDGLLCFNFRADRVRQLLGALGDPSFEDFVRPRLPRFVAAAGMVSYGAEVDIFMPALFPPQTLTNLLGHVVAANGRRQLRISETEKYPHVTYFFNGGLEDPSDGEDRIMVPSPKVATYDLQPEMSAPELTKRAVEAIGSGVYDLIVLNFPNPDMVGHTGSLSAAIKAVEAVDVGLGQIVPTVQARGGALFVTADHGNCELMRDPETGGPHTAHTTNLVPAILVGGGDLTLQDGRLSDIAPTLLTLMNLPIPAEMTGRSLAVRRVERHSIA
jgi:2,3-bisphosphoglycerate-independent phosphoglycerate mutase